MKDLSDVLHESFLFEEKKTLLSDHRLNEMSLLSDYSDKLPGGVKIYVYGENDEQGTKVPHFHVEAEDFIFEVHIKHIHNLDIWRTKKIDKKSNSNTWNGRANIRKSIAKWLDAKSHLIPNFTNAEAIITFWNGNNPNTRITNSYKD